MQSSTRTGRLTRFGALTVSLPRVRPLVDLALRSYGVSPTGSRHTTLALNFP